MSNIIGHRDFDPDHALEAAIKCRREGEHYLETIDRAKAFLAYLRAAVAQERPMEGVDPRVAGEALAVTLPITSLTS